MKKSELLAVSGVKSQSGEALVMLLLRTIGLLCLSLLLFVGRAHAGVIFHADLTTGAEAGANSFADSTRGAPTTGPGPGVGDPRPLSFGTANFFLNDAGTALSFTATVFNIDFTGTQTPGLNDNLVAAHIHAGGAGAPTLPVVWGFFGSPFNDLNSPGAPLLSDCTAFATGVGGTCSGTWDLSEGNNTTLAAQLPNLLAGRSYINFHTTQYTGGEIRGFLQVPEPATLVLVGLGLLGIAGIRRRTV
jgi:hypothetical protein